MSRARALACLVAFTCTGCFFSLEEPLEGSGGIGGVGGNAPLVDAFTTWRYLDTGDSAADWNTTTFDDSGWKEGPAELGYGDDDESTVVSFGPDENAKYVTTYFRHTFELEGSPTFTALAANVIRDDGIVLYLNDQELWRDNMFPGPVGPQVIASASVFDDVENVPVVTSLSASGLHAGKNVVAAEIHQEDPTSSDISFRLELRGE